MSISMELSNLRREAVRDYFRFADTQDGRWFDLFTDDAELTFPKFGTVKGKDGLLRFVQKMGMIVRKLEHDIDSLSFVEAGDTMVVEGGESGELADGTRFPDGTVSRGRFCSVYSFEGALIRSLRIYTDPDFASKDSARVEAFK